MQDTRTEAGAGDTAQVSKTPDYDAEFFKQPEKRQRGLGLGWHVALLFVLLTALFIAGIGWMMT